MNNTIDQVFEYLDKDQKDSAIQLIKENLSKRDQDFIEDLVPNLNIITDSSVEVVEKIMSSLLSILNLEDDVIRYSIIISLKKFVEEHKDFIFPFIEDYLKYGSPKKREGMLLLLQYIADTEPKSLEKYYISIVKLLDDPKEYIRKKAVNVLQSIGKTDKNEIEAIILKYLKLKNKKEENQGKAQNQAINKKLLEAADEILKNKKDPKEIEPEDQILIETADRIMRKQANGVQKCAQKDEFKKAASDVLKEIADLGSIEEIEIEKREMEAKAKALKEDLKEKRKNLQIERLKIEKEEREIEAEKLKQKKKQLKIEKELLDKQEELEQVRRELKLKALDEEKKKIKNSEDKRIQKKLKKLENLESPDDEFEELD